MDKNDVYKIFIHNIRHGNVLVKRTVRIVWETDGEATDIATKYFRPNEKGHAAMREWISRELATRP